MMYKVSLLYGPQRLGLFPLSSDAHRVDPQPRWIHQGVMVHVSLLLGLGDQAQFISLTRPCKRECAT